MTRVALYARYSSDNQSVASIEDQFRVCREHTVRGRWEITKVWDAVFPLVEPPLSEDGCGFILLDSNAPSHFALTNAIGVVNPQQSPTRRKEMV